MSIPRGTTPTFTLTFPETIDLTTANLVYVTFTSGTNSVTKTGDDLIVLEHQIDVYLSQQDTLMFHEGVVEIQANWMIGGNRISSEIAKYDISKQLLPKVI